MTTISNPTTPRVSEDGKDLSSMLVSLFERRYLHAIEANQLPVREDDSQESSVLLREITEMGREIERDEIRSVMPNILHACHNYGHTLMMVLQGEGKSQRVFLGGRRLAGRAKGSTVNYINSLESSFKTYYNGLKMGETRKLDDITGLNDLLQSAPCMSIVTGIPSNKKMVDLRNLQSLDRLARAAGSGRYAVVCIAEAVHPVEVDTLLDKLRRLKGEIHGLISTNVSTTTGGSKTNGYSQEVLDNDDRKEGKMLADIGSFLMYASFSIPGAGLAMGILGMATSAIGSRKLEEAENKPRFTQQFSESTTWSSSESKEVFNAHAAFCESLIDEHINRLQSAKSNGWWNMALYILAENEFVLGNLEGAIKSLCSGDNSTLEPIRANRFPPHLMRNSAIQGKLLFFDSRQHSHPLGNLYSSLSTCVNSEELSTLIHLPMNEIPGIRFRRHAEYALTIPENKEGKPDILLGSVYRDDKPLLDVRLTLESLNRHLFVTGMSGYGKTNTCMQILYECYTKHQIPFLIIDPVKTDYRNFLQVKGIAEHLRIFTIGATTALPLRLNPFELLPEELLRRNPGFLAKHIDLLKAVFNASFPGMNGGPLSYILEDAIIEAYQRKGWNIYNSTNRYFTTEHNRDDWYDLMPTLADMPPIMDVIMKRKNYGEETTREFLAALVNRINSLMQNNKGVVLNTSRSVPLSDLFERPCVIEIKDLGDNYDKAFVMALLFTLLYEYSECKRGESNELHHLTLIEEAHRLLSSSSENGSPDYGNPQAKAVATFTEMIAEMRGYGEGFIIADQSPTALNPNTIKNTNIKIIHRLAFPDDRKLAGDSVNLTTDQKNYLNSLDRGVAVMHEDRIEEAILLKAADFKGENFTNRPQQYEWDYLFEQMGARVKEKSKSYLFRHRGCRNCDNPCSYFYSSTISDDFDERIDGFAYNLAANEQQAAFETFKDWQHSHANAAPGYLYCVAINQLSNWVDKWLNAHAAVDLVINPAAYQLLKSKFLSAFAQVLPVILKEPEWKDMLKESLSIEKFIAAHFSNPPKELPGCTECPARCVSKSAISVLLQDEKKKTILRAMLKTSNPVGEFAPYLHGVALTNWEYCLRVHLK